MIPALAYLDAISEVNPVAYHERWQMACERRVVLNIYVSAGDFLFRVMRGSAIVGLPHDEDQSHSPFTSVLIYFEGDVNRSGMSFDDKVMHAAGRMVVRYPTMATATVPASHLVQVGTYDVATRTSTITDQAALDAWTAEAPPGASTRSRPR